MFKPNLVDPKSIQQQSCYTCHQDLPSVSDTQDKGGSPGGSSGGLSGNSLGNSRWGWVLLNVLLGLAFVVAPAWGVEASEATDPEITATLPKPTTASLLRQIQAYFVPPKQGAPKSTANSATRSSRSCGPQEPLIEAIAPPGGYGLTLSDRPQITLSLPPTSAQRVALIFRNETSTFFESALLPIPKMSERRWVSFQLPNIAPALPSGRYRWSLVVVCGTSIEPDDPTFMGWIERRETSPEMAQQHKSISPQQQARWYGQNGYWYDMIHQLSQPSQLD